VSLNLSHKGFSGISSLSGLAVREHMTCRLHFIERSNRQRRADELPPTCASVRAANLPWRMILQSYFFGPWVISPFV